MEVRFCMENCEREMFITLEENDLWQRQESAPRVDPGLENRILDEFKNAKFDLINNETSVAKTPNFIFRKHIGEFEKNIVWVEPADISLKSSTFLDISE